MKPGIYTHLFAFIISAAGYTAIGYFIPRTQTVDLLGTYFLLFLPYLYWCYSCNISYKTIVILSLLFRGLLLFALPALSDDFYRFYWDGVLGSHGYHPFDYIPSAIPNSILAATGLDHHLLNELNSPDYYSVYPPFLQGIFSFSAFMAQNSIQEFVLWSKGIMLLFDLLALWAMRQLLWLMGKPAHLAALYFLNPLIIVELNGNLHFEAIMVATAMASLVFAYHQKGVGAALMLTLSIGSKLYPVLLAPLLFLYLPKSERWKFTIALLAGTGLLFGAMFGWQEWQHMQSSIDLYFETFEFNASIFYLIRSWGFWWLGYDPIKTAGWVLGAITLFGYAYITWHFWQKPNIARLASAFGFSIALYYFMASSVMPWYLAGILAFTLFSSYRFALLWTAMVFLSYTAYTTTGVVEKNWAILLEYGTVFTFIVVEKWQCRKKSRAAS